MFLPRWDTRGGIVGVTGHRPDKIGGYDFYNPQRVWIRDQLRHFLWALKAERAVTGMALGVDQDFAYICCEIGLPFVAAVPCDGQESRWPAESQKFYRDLLARAESVVVVSPGPYGPWKMQVRNQWIVDNTSVLVAVWTGSEGGTANCVGYAQRKGKTIYYLNPDTWKAG